ncbi:NUDIX hydrolase [Sulfobacillus harzensis]|uniref:NUDIX domain-containing protein n=1 Tax=Sulfobacillus harzensis TaxID=2729629 RepID=A0A7Y0L7H2_9FIRM|nr:NUDIX domain-containing protein [Sulfobacillus harzensis]NMP24146.1 NUDIX domain-containing protein [Sulfobacillus harzensis]
MTDAARERHVVIVDVHAVLLRDERILLGRRHQTGYADGLFHLPAGHLEAGESVVEGLVREVREELGVHLNSGSVRFAHVMHSASGTGRVAFFFVADDWVGTPSNQETNKCSEIAWFGWDDLPDPMVPYARVALDHIRAGTNFSTFGW